MNSEDRTIDTTIKLIWSIVLILTSVFTLIYLGWTFDTPEKVDPQDWKRKWIIFFAWFHIASVCLVILYLLPIITKNPLIVTSLVFLIGFSVITSALTISYLGTTFTPPNEIDPADWKRKWIVFFAWLSLIGSIFNIYRVYEDRKKVVSSTDELIQNIYKQNQPAFFKMSYNPSSKTSFQ